MRLDRRPRPARPPHQVGLERARKHDPGRLAGERHHHLSNRVADIRAPGARNWDISLFKEFRFRERWTLQFRNEFLNAFNTVRFSGPNTSVNSNQFGVISSQANSPRQLQFGLKLLW